MENEIENTNNQNSEQITLSKDDFNKKIQGEADRVRTEYSKKLKELETKVKELTPIEKTEAEIDFENRLANLEAKEKKMALMDSLTENGVSHEFADYFKSDADIKAFANIYKSVIEKEVQRKITKNGYVPENHKAGTTLTKEDFAQMNMSEKEQLFSENPELYKTLIGR